MRKIAITTTLLLLTALALPAAAKTIDAATIMKAAMDQWRGATSSYTEMSMTIHRKDWGRTMRMKGWTKGEKTSLVRITAPKKDAGNGTLLIDKAMWSFTPKINRVIKIPSSMMNLSWMGSDFSNKDISRSTDILDQYTHKLIGTEKQDGHKVYIIESTPKEDAPIVWGKEVIRIRDDYVILEHVFYDQDMVKVKRMYALKIKTIGGRVMASQQRMYKYETPDEWTEIKILAARFDVKLPKAMFTLSNLRNPRY